MSRRDQRASGSPYDQASPPSYQPAPADSSYTYGYQPESYPTAGTGYGDGHPRAAVFPASASGLPGYGQLPSYQPAAGRNDSHESSGRGAESQSRRGHRDATDRRERKESTSAKHEHSKSKHRKSGRDGHRDSNIPSDSRHGRTSSRPSPTSQGAGAAPGGSSHQASRGQRYLSPLPPMPGAPKITRLPTPNFDDEDGYDDDGYCRHNVSAYQFCACCANERQMSEARSHHSSWGHSGRSGRH